MPSCDNYIKIFEKLLISKSIDLKRIKNLHDILYKLKGYGLNEIRERLFLYSCNNGYIGIIKQLLKEKKLNINRTTKCGNNGLSLACKKGYYEIVKILLKTKINIDLPSKCKKYEQCKLSTPFTLACEHGHLNIVKLLLTKGINVNHEIINGKTGFYIACEKDYVEIVKLLLNDDRIDVNISDINNDYTGFIIACLNGYYDIVKLLLSNNKININYNNNESALYVACRSGNIDIVKLLLESDNIKINEGNILDESPFYTACDNGRIEIIKTLLEDKRTDVNKAEYYKYTPFLRACKNGNLNIIKLLYNNHRIIKNKILPNNSTYLILTTNVGNICTTKYILSKNICDINHRDNNNKSAIDYAYYLQDFYHIELLLSSYQHIDTSNIIFNESNNNNYLIKEYRKNPEYVSNKLRIKLKITNIDSANIFNMIVLLSDGYFNLYI